ncbi:MAG: FAD-dependent oxidoreductase [Gammaproteobacteria bacterium]|nr:FAD-dependent oxidoreductase [Gammaproteobacteria bacterium]MBQ0839204.1 FAD-dependent oxidoreductase [Gammaproteobacteria bacterium]
MTETAVIVGGGQAGAQAAVSLRQGGFTGRVVLIGDEPVLPYQRPPLSKTYLAGELAKERLFIKPAAFYDKINVERILGKTVSAIDSRQQVISLSSGQCLSYQHLILATGGRVRQLDCPGAGHPRVHYLRTLADVEAMQSEFTAGARMVVIGGGYVGLETAAVAVKHGLNVTLLVARPTPLGRVTSPEVGKFFEDVHRQAGVTLCCNTGVSAIEDDAGDGQVAAVVTDSGYRVLADVVVVGIGLLPNVELAESAGVACDDGITVDEYGRTSVGNIYAAGDCANHPNPIYGRRLRLESVQNAVDQGKTVAATICGKDKPYAQVPWFWSDQYDLKLQTAGINSGYDQALVRGDIASRSFAVFYLREGRLLAVDAINRPAEFVAARNILSKGLSVSAERLQDESIPAKALADQTDPLVTENTAPESAQLSAQSGVQKRSQSNAIKHDRVA